MWIFLELKMALRAFCGQLDRLVEVARFILTMTTVITSRVVEMFVNEIVVNFGLLREIICDNDTNS